MVTFPFAHGKQWLKLANLSEDTATTRLQCLHLSLPFYRASSWSWILTARSLYQDEGATVTFFKTWWVGSRGSGARSANIFTSNNRASPPKIQYSVGWKNFYRLAMSLMWHMADFATFMSNKTSQILRDSTKSTHNSNGKNHKNSEWHI
jgi:hypothetical protein